LSNYDALDEEDLYDDEGEYDTDDSLINSDFNKREPIDTVAMPPRNGNSSTSPPCPSSSKATTNGTVPQMPSSKYILGLIESEETQREVSFAQFDDEPMYQHEQDAAGLSFVF
jgi:hypothetical protein